MRPAILAGLLLLVFAASQQIKLPAQSASKTPEATPKETETWGVTFSNVYKDSDESFGHGEGDILGVLVHGETAVGGLAELEGSAVDPSDICMTGTFHNGFLRLQNYPADFKYHVDQITVRGKIYDSGRGLTFHGRIRGGPFHSDPKGDPPHFPTVVTLPSKFDDTPWMVADELANDGCACQWKKHVSPNLFITAKCDLPADPHAHAIEK